MTTATTFCVIYQFKVRPGMEREFKEGWRKATEAIRDKRGGLGSRLHLTPDGIWLAYAQWPDRETWEIALRSESAADPEATDLMRRAVQERYAPILLVPQLDLLQHCPAGPVG